MAFSLQSRPSHTLTIEDLTETFPTVTLKLRAKEVLEKKGEQETSYFKKMKQEIKALYQRLFEVKEELKLEANADAATTARNQARLDEIFDDITRKTEEMRRNAKAQLHTMTPQQQEDVITYWSSVGGFLKEVLNWLQRAFDYVLEKIREGFRIVKEGVQYLFNTLADLFRGIF